MFELHDPIPSKKRTLTLRKNFNHSLLQSLKLLIEACQPVVPSSIFENSIQCWERINSRKKQTGLLSLVHKNLVLAVQGKNIENAVTSLKNLTKLDTNFEEIKYRRFEDLPKTFSDDVLNICTSEFDRTVSIKITDEICLELAKKQFKKTLSILEKVSPEFYGESLSLISEIILFSGRGIQAGSSFDLFGMIHINYSYKLKKITDTLDFLIHEQSHLYLYMIMAEDPLVLNPLSAAYLSPLREEKRTMQGVYHAVFVLTKIIYVLNLSLKKNLIPKKEIIYCQELIFDYKNKMEKSYKEIMNHANLTDLGKSLINSAVIAT